MNFTAEIASMSDEELLKTYEEFTGFLETIEAEQDRRLEKERLREWKKIADAIDEYTKKYGPVIVETHYCQESLVRWHAGYLGTT